MNPEDNINPNNEEDYGSDWPELDAIENIIDRIRFYTADHNCSAKIVFQIEFAGLPSNEVREKYTVTAVPLEENPTIDYTKMNKDLKKIITEEMASAFPDISDIPLDPNNVEHKQIIEAVTQFVEDNDINTRHVSEMPSKADDKPHDGIISVKMLEEEQPSAE